MAAGDYPTWVYDPTGVNPPIFVQNDPQFVALLNAPLPSSAVPGTTPQTMPPPPATVPQAPSGAVPVAVGSTTLVPAGARFTKAPGSTPAPVAPLVVNTRPNVRPKNG